MSNISGDIISYRPCCVIRVLFSFQNFLRFRSDDYLCFRKSRKPARYFLAMLLKHLTLMTFLQIFEKVLVQNIQFGLSPSLTSALHSIPRSVVTILDLPPLTSYHQMEVCQRRLPPCDALCGQPAPVQVQPDLEVPGSSIDNSRIFLDLFIGIRPYRYSPSNVISLDYVINLEREM